jgi:hypothetical protein
MRADLDALLCERYPALFAQRHLPMAQTAMCWGFSCGDGWFNLIDELCAKLQAGVASGAFPQPEAVQVKEKFGELRFYLSGETDEAIDLVEEATQRSMTICEVRGASGALRIQRHWYRTRCDVHADPDSEIVPPEPPGS